MDKGALVFVAIESDYLFLLEFDIALFGGINRKIITHIDIFAGVKFSAMLADDDIAGDDMGAAKNLDSKSFGFRIPS